jgi:hypothetical protein
MAPHDATQCRVGFQRRGVDADRLPLDQACVRQPLQHPDEDRLVRLEHRSSGASARSSNGPAGASGNTKPRNSRSANESAARQAIARSASKPSKCPISSNWK